VRTQTGGGAVHLNRARSLLALDGNRCERARIVDVPDVDLLVDEQVGCRINSGSRVMLPT